MMAEQWNQRRERAQSDRRRDRFNPEFRDDDFQRDPDRPRTAGDYGSSRGDFGGAGSGGGYDSGYGVYDSDDHDRGVHTGRGDDIPGEWNRSGFGREHPLFDAAYIGRDDPRRGRPRHGGERSWWDRAGDEVSSWFGDEGAMRRRDRDHHRGRGPRGYARSDERILEDVHERLTDDPHIDASDIEVAVSGREVTLTGTVDSRFAKRHAEDIVDSVSGVAHCQNNLRVRSREQRPGLADRTNLGGTTSTDSDRR